MEFLFGPEKTAMLLSPSELTSLMELIASSLIRGTQELLSLIRTKVTLEKPLSESEGNEILGKVKTKKLLETAYFLVYFQNAVIDVEGLPVSFIFDKKVADLVARALEEFEKGIQILQKVCFNFKPWLIENAAGRDWDKFHWIFLSYIPGLIKPE